MPSPTTPVKLYQQLAEESQRTGRTEDRERFWLLAADAALQAGKPEEAERLRRTVLSHNANHFLRPYNSFAEAIKTPDILKYIQDLRKHYPPAQAERLLESLRAQAAAKAASEQNVNKAALATLQPNQALPVARRPQPAAVPPPPEPARTGISDVFQMAPRQSEGPAKKAQRPTGQPRKSPSVREFQAGAWIGTLLFLALLVAGLAAIAQLFVLPLLR